MGNFFNKGHHHKLKVVNELWFELGDVGESKVVFWLVKQANGSYGHRKRIRIQDIEYATCDHHSQVDLKTHISKKLWGQTVYKERDYQKYTYVNNQLYYMGTPYTKPYIMMTKQPPGDPDIVSALTEQRPYRP